MDTQAEAFDVDRELEAWLDKEAAAQGVDRSQLRQQELEVWQRWRQDPNPHDFEWLYNSHQPLLNANLGKYKSNLPRAAVKSYMLHDYINALETYDPSKAAFATHLNHSLQHTGRYILKHTNIGKIPEERAHMVGLLENRLAHLREQLGREPSSIELADDMKSSAGEIGEISKSLQKLTPRKVETLRRELRRDLLSEMPGAETHTESSRLADHLVFLHGSLSPEQQVVLEHTPLGDLSQDGQTAFGKPGIEDPMELSPVIGMSPQKIRAIRKQIMAKAKKHF